MGYTLRLGYSTVVVAGVVMGLLAAIATIIGAFNDNANVVIDLVARVEAPEVTVNVELEGLTADDLSEIVEAARIYKAMNMR